MSELADRLVKLLDAVMDAYREADRLSRHGLAAHDLAAGGQDLRAAASELFATSDKIRAAGSQARWADIQHVRRAQLAAGRELTPDQPRAEGEVG